MNTSWGEAKHSHNKIIYRVMYQGFAFSRQRCYLYSLFTSFLNRCIKGNLRFDFEKPGLLMASSDCVACSAKLVSKRREIEWRVSV